MIDKDGDGIPDVLQLSDSEDSGDESDLDHFESCWDIYFKCRSCSTCLGCNKTGDTRAKEIDS